MLTGDMRTKVADFGLSMKLKGHDEETSTMCGTPNYLSPEIANQTSYGFKSDCWSLGIILYVLLAGRSPFEGENQGMTLKRIKSGKFVMPKKLSANAQDLIHLILTQDTEKRLTTDEMLVHPFFNCAESYTIESTENILQYIEKEEESEEEEEVKTNGTIEEAVEEAEATDF